MALNHTKLEQYYLELKGIVGDSSLLYDEASKQHYGKDLTQKFNPSPLAIVFPSTEAQVVSIVNWANKSGVPLVPSGGRSGYSGGAVAKNNELVVSFEKFNRIIKFNKIDRQITCEPGVKTKQVQALALENNLMYPVDFASSGSSQIGGNIATNAGGIKVLRYGLTRDWVSGLRVVTGEGKILQLNNGLIKNSCGYDIRHLFIGSEGTLGFITEATLNLTKANDKNKVILLALTANSSFIDILNEYRDVVTPTAFEFYSELALSYVVQELNLNRPFKAKSPYYILLEYESDQEADESALNISNKLLENQCVVDVIISSNSAQCLKLWQYRESISLSLLKYTPYKYDIAVMPSEIEKFIAQAEKLFEEIYPGFEIVWFGHVGDGNLHLNVLKPQHLNKDDFFALCDRMSERVFELIQQFHGSISAEHGVGLLKNGFLHYTKNQDEINYMRSIKRVFDPNNIMNPGKIF